MRETAKPDPSRDHASDAANEQPAASGIRRASDLQLVQDAAAALVARRIIDNEKAGSLPLDALLREFDKRQESYSQQQSAYFKAHSNEKGAPAFEKTGWGPRVDLERIASLYEHIGRVARATPFSVMKQQLASFASNTNPIVSWYYACQRARAVGDSNELLQRMILASQANAEHPSLFDVLLASPPLFDWVSTPEELGALERGFDSFDEGSRFQLIALLGANAAAQLSARGRRVTPSAIDASKITEENYDGFIRGLVAADRVDLSVVSINVGRLPEAVRRRLLALGWAKAAEPTEWQSPNLSFVTLVVSARERAPYLAPLSRALLRSLSQWLPIQGMEPWFLRLREEFTPAQRAEFDAGLLKLAKNESSDAHKLAVALGLIPDPDWKRAPSVAQPVREVDAVQAPQIRHDHGHLDDGFGNIDPKKHQTPTAKDLAQRAYWWGKLQAAKALRPDLADALRTYEHFLEATGTPLQFSYDRFAETDQTGADNVKRALEYMQKAAVEASERHPGPSARFFLQSGAIPSSTGTENWQKAIGQHVIWLEGQVSVVRQSNGTRGFSIKMTLHAEDRYNFNPGASDIGTGVADSDNGRFEITGLGKEFMSLSTLRRDITFEIPPGRMPDLPRGAEQGDWVRVVNVHIVNPAK